ncbi:YeiH family protein [Staphylococcus auricularis]|uniref:YeiH family protein n=1 Tax=Staphylococcus auricularis TaxID=29379 RepID=UPI0012450D89|nr:YeiH family protein [Staphylococcus auricularis]HJE02127.1 YeiH family protein [Staphylococcus auricularis]
MTRLKGLTLTVTIAVIATLLGMVVPVIGSAIFAIIFGMVVNHFIRLPDSFTPGIKYSGKKILHYSIIVLGFTLSFQAIGEIGLRSLPIIISTLIGAFLVVYMVMKLLRLDTKLSILIGVGTAICGGSAIAATSPVIKARESQVAYAISTIFLFNIIAVFIFPPLGHLLHMSQTAFGYFGGTAINDTSSVVAATANYGGHALATGTIVKLTRTLMIVPVVLFFTYLTVKEERERNHRVSIFQIFPWFIVWFVVASFVSTVLNFPPALINVFHHIALFLITIAMAGIGLTVDMRQFKQAGIKPVILGLLTWLVVIVISLIMMKYIQLF